MNRKNIICRAAQAISLLLDERNDMAMGGDDHTLTMNDILCDIENYAEGYDGLDESSAWLEMTLYLQDERFDMYFWVNVNENGMYELDYDWWFEAAEEYHGTDDLTSWFEKACKVMEENDPGSSKYISGVEFPDEVEDWIDEA